MSITRDSIPALRRGIRRHYDATRGQNVLQGPERVILLDDIADAITQLIDAQNSIAAIARILAERYATDLSQVEPDVLAFIEELAGKSLVTF